MSDRSFRSGAGAEPNSCDNATSRIGSHDGARPIGSFFLGFRSLSPEQEGRWCAGCDAPGQGGDDIGEHQRAERDKGNRQNRHARLGNGIDLSGEEGPEPASQHYPKRHADHDPDDGSDRRLPGQRRPVVCA